MLAGIGFTVSLFMTELAYGDPDLVNSAKLGVLAGSVVAAIAGALVLRLAHRGDGPARHPVVGDDRDAN